MYISRFGRKTGPREGKIWRVLFSNVAGCTQTFTTINKSHV